MISFASSVQGEPALTPSLIAFYATVATVIPVLFIALAVQGTTVQWLAVTYFRRAGDLSFVKKLPSRPRAFRVMVLPAAALALSVVGAVHSADSSWWRTRRPIHFAIYDLYQGADTSMARGAVVPLVSTRTDVPDYHGGRRADWMAFFYKLPLRIAAAKPRHTAQRQARPGRRG